MEVRVEVSVVRAMPAMPGRSRSKRLRSSAEKCWESAAEPPLPQLMTLPSCFRDSAMSAPALRMAGISTLWAACLVAMLSRNIWFTRSSSFMASSKDGGSAGLEGVLYPFYRRRAALTRDGHHIEAQGLAPEVGALLEQVLGGEDEFAALVGPHGLGRGAAAHVLAVADFRHHQGVPLQQHQIQFALGATVVTQQELQALGLEHLE